MPPRRTRCNGLAGLDVGAITQEDPTQPRENWQAAYDERLLTPEGDADQRASWPIMHYLDPDRPLSTPLGDVTIPAATERPERLQWLVYEEP